MTDDTLAKLREWLREQLDNAADNADGDDTEEGMYTSEGMAYAYDDVLDWLDRNAKGGQGG